MEKVEEEEDGGKGTYARIAFFLPSFLPLSSSLDSGKMKKKERNLVRSLLVVNRQK